MQGPPCFVKQPSFHTQARGDCRFSKDVQKDRRVKKQTGDGSSAYVYAKGKKIFRFRTAIWNRKGFERETFWSSSHAEIIEANKKKNSSQTQRPQRKPHEGPVRACSWLCVCVCVYVPSISSLNKVCWIKLKGLGSRQLASGCNQLSHKIFRQCRESAVIERLFGGTSKKKRTGSYAQGPGFPKQWVKVKLAETSRLEFSTPSL